MAHSQHLKMSLTDSQERRQERQSFVDKSIDPIHKWRLIIVLRLC